MSTVLTQFQLVKKNTRLFRVVKTRTLYKIQYMYVLNG